MPASASARWHGPIVRSTKSFAFEAPHELLGEARVEVVAAQVVVTRRGQDLDDAALDGEDGDVEGAPTQVVDHDGLVLLLVHPVGQRGCRRLVDDALHVEAGDDAGILRGLALRIGEVGGHGDDRVGYRLAQIFLGIPLELVQDHGGDLLWQVLLAVDLDLSLIHI